MRNLDSDALASFVAVAETGSFTAAAERLGRTQAAVSMAIGKWEERLDLRLFDRGHRRVTLTPIGERLLGYARRIRAIEDEALATLLEGRNESRVRLGMPDDYLTLFGTALMQRFAPQHPKVNLDLQYDFSHHLEGMVESRELDIAIITQSPAEPKGELIRLERQVWCAAPNRYPEHSSTVQLALFPDGCRSRPQVLAALDRADRRWRIVYSSSDIAGIQLAVHSGDLLTVLPETAVPANWRKLGMDDGLPELPILRLAMVLPQQPRLPVRQLATFLRAEFQHSLSTT
ncbi:MULTISPECIES: LysR family transcriptional regulator [Rhizobium/Agrobacterium group]|uniref:LysR family transcriptional regulator n=1 Tax=Rhizobium/Agrobacterium group TaxID=227290 RepID=UPI0012E7ACEA|nr:MULTISPECIES: LysR family transcriptional regulator [Rhizobium/Agrobacterium group]MCF1447080.1 LysR family transcriptional regulator [Allorhizobium ampelinum]MCF1462138.1 LysR family transcriptional regulator [Allorhizobium ampelinum]MCF1493531.1 LysR family transcriptional regulator [Allorhizobium ampelinum]MVA46485.1 LysR family transcriptional regulator [Agrobacterium vitis]MVA63870.1 LysR family transcriptional regulator [Agrobacterium vitis]